jgi:TRAP-type C4-dicarboxylate transport system substrate-binding protein
MWRGAGLALVAAVIIAAATACDGADADKAGGPSAQEPVTLTLAKHDVNWAFAAFVAATSRLSGGSIRIEVLPDWRGGEVGYERGTVADVRAAKVQVGVVGVRVWDTMGVTSFRGLVAPFLIDNLELQRRVLESPVAAEMLEGVEQAGVVGLAVLPGALRRPLGFSRRLVRPSDYTGATVGVTPGGVARATIRALRARPNPYPPGVVSGLDGAELDLATIAQNAYDELAPALASNVVLWPRAETIVMNREAFEALTQEQQEILRRAGREALAPELRRVERDEEAALNTVCERGKLSLATASATDLGLLRAAVRPVYAELERDAQTREWIGEITKLRQDDDASSLYPLRCPKAQPNAKTAASTLEGRWTVSWSRNELLAAGIEPTDADALQGRHVLEFSNGRFRSQTDPTTGTYTLAGDILRLVFDNVVVGVTPGKVYELRWSVYRDSLSFAAVEGREPLLAMTMKPFRRT